MRGTISIYLVLLTPGKNERDVLGMITETMQVAENVPEREGEIAQGASRLANPPMRALNADMVHCGARVEGYLGYTGRTPTRASGIARTHVLSVQVERIEPSRILERKLLAPLLRWVTNLDPRVSGTPDDLACRGIVGTDIVRGFYYLQATSLVGF